MITKSSGQTARTDANNETRFALTPEHVIEIFDADARDCVTRNLQGHCADWLWRHAWLLESRVRGNKLKNVWSEEAFEIHKVLVQIEESNQYKCERQIKYLQRCLEILDNRTLFAPTATPGTEHNVVNLKSRLNITDVIERHMALRPTGNTYKGQCPFHNDRSPSFVVYPDSQRWWCFGCSEGGDVITFMKKLRNCDFRMAVTELERL